MEKNNVLVVSHNSLDYGNANGRSILNLIDFMDNQNVSHISLFPNTSTYVVKNHLCLNETNILFKRIANTKNDSHRDGLGKKNRQISKIKNIVYHFLRKKTIKNIIRAVLWMRKKYIFKMIDSFVLDNKPNIIIYQVGDFFGLNEVVIHISELTNSHLILYFTEDYYLKGTQYFRPFGFGWKKYSSSFERLMCMCEYSIFSNNSLQTDFLRKFDVRSDVIYISSDYPFSSNYTFKTNFNDLTIGYFGNLGLNRHKSILKVAKYFEEKYPNFVIDIFSSCTDRKLIRELKSKSNIRYNGYIEYNKLHNQMLKCDFLLLAEDTTKRNMKNLKYAFTTKIADYLSTGIPIISIGNKDIEIIKYVTNNQISLHFDYLSKINLLSADSIEIYTKLNKTAYNVFDSNHSKEKSQEKVKLILKSLNE